MTRDTPPILTRHPQNPVLSAADVPFDSTLTMNAGVAKVDGRYLMVFRNDYGFADAADFRQNSGPGHRWKTNLGIAWSDDGVAWTVDPEPLKLPLDDPDIRRAYDPRLSVIDGRLYLCFAADTGHGIRGGVAVSDGNPRAFEVLSLSLPDNRNMVLLPERIGPAKRLARLERPFPVYGRGGGEQFDLWYSDSADGRDWGNHRLVLATEDVPWCRGKIGPGVPPIRTDAGYLALIHVVDDDPARVLPSWEPKKPWTKRYTVGAMLLDLDEPWRVIGLSREPVMEPDAPYEAEGFRGGVIFPGGMVDEGDGTVKVYYGAADTVECLATARIDDLLAACEPFPHL